jgi:hypothetical protein
MDTTAAHVSLGGLAFLAGIATAGCSGARMVLESPVNQRCAAAGLKACPELTAGVLDYVEGNEDEALKHLRRGAAENGKAKIKQFADSLGGLGSLPGADSFMDPINKVIDALLSDDGAGAAGSGDERGDEGAPRPRPAPPKGAAGFRFGQSLAEVEAACLTAGSWKGGDAPTCSAAPVEVGFDARIKFGVTDGALDTIALRTRPESAKSTEWVAIYKRAAAGLRKKYGAPVTSTTAIPNECRDSLPDCLYDGRAKALQVWKWPAGETISLRMWGSEDVPPAITIVYSVRDVKATRSDEGL